MGITVRQVGAPVDADYLVKTANGTATAERVVTDTATIATDWATAGQAKPAVVDGSISDAKLRTSAAVSVIGRSANSGGAPADIAAASNDTFLQRVGNALAFGALTIGMFGANLITYAKIQQVSATDKLLGRSTAGAGDIEEIACTAAGRALLDDASAAAQIDTLAAAPLAGNKTITGGFAATSIDDGTKTTGTFTPTFLGGNIRRYINGGAHTLDPPTGEGTMVFQVTNNGSAGAITTSAFTKVDGDSLTTTNGHDFFFFITVINAFKHLHVKALQ